MSLKKLSVTLVTSRLSEVKTFYETHFSAKAIFDCGWYVVLKLENTDNTEICLMEPQNGASEFAGGMTLNLQFSDVDAIYNRLLEKEISVAIPLEDHPWGDRGFGIIDPIGTMVYCYHDIEPSDEFKAFFK